MSASWISLTGLAYFFTLFQGPIYWKISPPWGEIVLDSGSWDRVVVFVGAGCWENLRRYAGNLEWGGVEEGEVSLRVTWDQGGQDPITPRRVSK
jgi:hypothetical protein